ncbi:MAG: SH3 domain-containing protein [Eubacterium sp.]|nr:SH3 domain-containing protein [Eubacterium sp.]
MSNKVTNFFSNMKNDEHRVFEITMFSVSSVVALVVVACCIMLGSLYFNNGNQISDEEANAGSVTGTAVTEREEAEPTATPDSNSVIHEDDFNSDIDEELANSEYAYTTTNVNMRSEASLTAGVLVKVPSSTKVKVVKLTDDKEWCQVEYNGQTGYIKSLYLSTTKPEPIATVAPTARPTQQPTTTKAPKATKTPKPKATKTPKPTTDVQATPITVTEPPKTTPVRATEAPTEAPTKEPVVTEAPTKEPAATTAPTQEPSESSN